MSPARRYNRIWRADEYVEGACNGLLCLCDDAKPGGAISLVSPETVGVPPLPDSAQWLWTEIHVAAHTGGGLLTRPRGHGGGSPTRQRGWPRCLLARPRGCTGGGGSAWSCTRVAAVSAPARASTRYLTK